jgi:hypothetical protein
VVSAANRINTHAQSSDAVAALTGILQIARYLQNKYAVLGHK